MVDDLPKELLGLAPRAKQRLRWLRDNYSDYFVFGRVGMPEAAVTEQQAKSLGRWDSVLKGLDAMVPENLPSPPPGPSGLCVKCHQPLDVHTTGLTGDLCP